MCLATALQVIELDGSTALCDSCGVRRKIRVDLIPDVKVGDYVLAHAGFAIERLDEESALANRDAVQEVLRAL